MKTSFEEGTWVWHKKHGIGTVALISNNEVLIEFKNGTDEIFAIEPKKRPPLSVLNPEGFWLQKKNNQESLATIVKTNPLEALLALVKDEITELTFAQLQKAVVPELITEAEWDTWSKETSALLKKDPRFEMGKDNKITYRGDLVQIAEDIMARFRKAPSLKEKQRVCRDIVKLEEKDVPIEEVKEAAISFFTGTAANDTNKMGARLEALFFLKSLDSVQHESLKEPLYDEIENLDIEAAAQAVAEAADNSIRTQLIEIIRQKKPDQFIAIATQLCKRFKKTQRDWVLDCLLADKDHLPIKTIIETTMADIPTNLQPFVWLAKNTILNPDKISAIGVDPSIVIPAMFKIFSNIHLTSAFSVRPKDDRSVSSEEDELLKLLKDHKKLLAFLKKQPDSIVKSFALLYRDCNPIPNDIREDFINNKFATTFPDIHLEEATAYGGEDGIILTRETFEKHQAEYKEIVDHGLEEATKAIKTAREWGDISENAELNIAQENQRKIIIRKVELEHLLENCQVLD